MIDQEFVAVINNKSKFRPTTGDYSPVVEYINRVPRQHVNWRSIKYKGKKYQLFGGVRNILHINVDRPIRTNAERHTEEELYRFSKK